MKYEYELIIDLPRDKVIELFDSQDNLLKWQEGLISFEHVEGVPRTPGAVSKLIYASGEKTMEMMETITVWNPPDEISGIYEADGTGNEIKNFFHPTDDGKTRWICASDFKTTGFFKVVVFFFPGIYKRQTLKFMKSFKDFAEGEGRGLISSP